MNSHIHNISAEHAQLRMLKRQIRNTRLRLTTAIMKIVRPAMWESGYVHGLGDSTPLKLVCFPNNRAYKPRLKNTFSLANEYTGIYGFTEKDAVITDAYGGGLVTNSLHDMEIEDLITLFSWVDKHRHLFKSS